MASVSTTGNQADKHFAHHYESPDHQFFAAKEGIWLFMVTEILMFGGLFVAYFIFHSLYPEVFKRGSETLDWRLGSLNTIVLIASSFTMAWAINLIQRNKQAQATWALLITILCGVGFMVIKSIEYSAKFHHGYLPPLFFPQEAIEFAHQPLYYGFYFCMTGLHGIHVMMGMALIFWVMIKNIRGEFDSTYYTPVEGVGIFWHIVDLIWIFLFPLLYLVG